MSTKTVISPPLKFGENAAIGIAIKKLSLAVEASPSRLKDYRSISYWVNPENTEETKVYIKYLLELGFKPRNFANSIDFTFKALTFEASIMVNAKYLNKIKVPVKPVIEEEEKIVDFPELEAALNPTELKS